MTTEKERLEAQRALLESDLKDCSDPGILVRYPHLGDPRIKEDVQMRIDILNAKIKRLEGDQAEEPRDKVVEAVRADLLRRSQLGIKKYGVTLERTDLSLKDWLQHAYEETLDQANYLKRAIIAIEQHQQE